MLTMVRRACEYINSQIEEKPIIGMILGSGLGYLADKIQDQRVINYKDIPNFPVSTVIGHEGKLVVGKLEGVQVITLKGRFHAYEGHKIRNIAFPIYVMKELGVKGLILTNAAGGVNMMYKPGDIVANRDFINFSFKNPLIGPNKDEIGPRFPSMAFPCDSNWIKRVINQSKAAGIEIKSGTYCWFLGPSYETPAEIKLARKLGADLVGMSTMPEVIAANHCSIKVISFSAVTNMAAGILPQPLNHKEVLAVADQIKGKFESVVKTSIKLF